MEALFSQSSPEKSLSQYKHIKITRRNDPRAFVSRPSENLAPIDIIHGGCLFGSPPSLSFSHPSSASLLNPFHQSLQSNHQRQQPPLLPLPVSHPHFHNSLPSGSRGLSSSPTNKKGNKRRDLSLTPKKSKSKQLNTTGEEPKKDLKPKGRILTRAVSESLVIAPANPLGPDPNDLPKDVCKVFSSSLTSKTVTSGDVLYGLEKFSGSVFLLSPPPSSLPLPKFSLRPKRSCNVEAAEIDARATNNLRQLLRLR